MTNRPNLTEEEKEHYNKVAVDMNVREGIGLKFLLDSFILIV
jgi:hypothetical protein